MVEVYSPVGADLTKTHSTAQFKLGTIVHGEQGQCYMYCKSSGAHVFGALVAIDEDFVSRSATTTIAATAARPGWPQIAFATDEYGFIAIEGNGGILGKQKDGTAANAQLYTSASVGIMSSESSTATPLMLAGVRNVALTSGAGVAYEICAVNPHFVPKTTALA